MTWHLWQIKTMAGDFWVSEKQKDQIVEQVQDRDSLIMLPTGESFAAHQFLAALTSEVEDPEWRKHQLAEAPPPEPKPLTPEEQKAHDRRMKVIRESLSAPKGQHLTPLQKELKGVPQHKRAEIIKRHMDAAAKAGA